MLTTTTPISRRLQVRLVFEPVDPSANSVLVIYPTKDELDRLRGYLYELERALRDVTEDKPETPQPELEDL